MNSINIVKPNNTKILEKSIELCNTSIKKNIDYWNQYDKFNKILSKTDLYVIFADEYSYDWLYDQCSNFDLEKALPSKNILNNKTLMGGGGVNGYNTNQLVFWQIIGSNSDKEMFNTGNRKLFGHLFIHALQVKFSLEYSNNKNPLKITDYPCWFVEGQSDYHAIKTLDEDFGMHKNNFLRTAYVPDGYRKKIKNFNIEEWKDKLINDSFFEGVPITHQYWSGFFVYEYLINTYGSKLLIDVMLDFINTLDFDISMNKVLNLDVKDFYDKMSIMLFDLAKKVVA